MNIITKTITMPDGTQIHIETGKLAKQADGSVVIRQGNCMILASVCSNKDAKEDMDFLPLSVDYQEKYAANGRFPGGFNKREGRLSEYEILISRLVDRALRPLFPDDYHADTQVLLYLISADENVAPDSLAALAASCAIAVSDIPFGGPISEVRIARVEGKLKINPTIKEAAIADMDFLLAATMDNVVMLEGEAKECSEDDLIEAIKLGHEAIKLQVQAQLDLQQELGKTIRTYSHERNDEDLKKLIHDFCFDPCKAIAKVPSEKKARGQAFDDLKASFVEAQKEINPEKEFDKFLLKKYFHDTEKEAMRSVILDEGTRLDGRTTTEIRPIWCEVDYLPTPHGSSIFTRGETQALATVTLGSKDDEQMIDGAMFKGYNRFQLNYNFPPFSVGEVRPMRGVGRREVGHGNLAMRSLKQVLPTSDINPYTIRLVSDVLESNGSSSMATVCSGTMALMDAGVQLKAPVSGIAMGLITDGSKYAVLSDILGDEDHLGDMDFKVTGTQKGICGVQMDIKIDGLPYPVLIQALEQAKTGRLHILDEMAKTITQPRADYKPHVPRIIQIIIDGSQIGAVIGPGGKVIQEIQKESNTKISIEEKDEKGIVEIFSSDKEGMERAFQRIKAITAKPELNAIYEGKVKTIMEFGAFVEIMPGKDGLLHISEISHERIATMQDSKLKEGDILTVKLIEIDKKTGKLRLSKKVLETKA